MDMANVLHDGLGSTYRTPICQSAPQGMSFPMVLPDGWDWARFLELVLSFSSFPFPTLFLPSRR